LYLFSVFNDGLACLTELPEPWFFAGGKLHALQATIAFPLPIFQNFSAERTGENENETIT